MRFPTLSLWLSSVCALSACGSASLQAPAVADRPKPAIADPALNCSPLMTAPAKMRGTPTSPATNGWVLVQYRLDGSGKAQQIEVLDQFRAEDVAKEVVNMLRAASYRQGEVRERCQMVVSYQVVQH